MTPEQVANQVVSSPKMMLLVAGGVFGGLVIGGAAVKHLFIHGIDEEERKGMLKIAAIGLATWGVVKLVGQENAWWLDMNSIATHFDPSASASTTK